MCRGFESRRLHQHCLCSDLAAQSQLTLTPMPPVPPSSFQAFVPSKDVCAEFHVSRAGGPCRRWLHRGLGWELPVEMTHEILQEAMEGAVLACFQQRFLPNSSSALLRYAHWGALKQAVERRLPNVRPADKSRIADKLVNEFEAVLKSSRILRTEGADVTLTVDGMVARRVAREFEAERAPLVGG